jgi:hypothetical protein
MLFDGGNGEDDGGIGCECFDLGPGEVGPVHGRGSFVCECTVSGVW